MQLRSWNPLGIVIGGSLAACFIKPDPPTATTPADASGGGGDARDVPSVDAPLQLPCPLLDDFNGGGLCDGWGSGSSSGGMSLSLDGDQLFMDGGGEFSGYAECEQLMASPWGAGGAIVAIPQILATSGGKTGLFVTFGDGERAGVELWGTGPGTPASIQFYVPGTALAVTDPVTDQVYWALRPIGGATIVLLGGPTPTSLVEIARASRTNMALTSIKVEVNASTPSGGAARFDNLMLCQ